MLSPEELRRILYVLPAAQRDSARERIRLAEYAGWFGIQLWFWGDGRQHEADLVGFDRKATFGFLPYDGTPKEK